MRLRKIIVNDVKDVEKKFLEGVVLMANAYRHWKIWQENYGAKAKQNMKESHESMKRFLDSLNIVDNDTDPAADIS